MRYENGQGIQQDDAQAMSWYRKAADQGDAAAQFNLGLSFEKGEGIAQDDAEAASWYRKSAGKGETWAQFNLGLIYQIGQGVSRDEPRRCTGIARRPSRATLRRRPI